VGHLAARAPVLLMLEDLHWADEMSLRLLGFLARRVQIWPVLVIATARDDEVTDAPMLRSTVDSLEREAHVTRLVLAPLSRADTGTLVRVLAGRSGGTADPPRLVEQVWQTSEGSPLVAIETLRTLEHGSLSLASAKPPLPERVRELITRRLDQLNERSRQLVAVVSVIGRDFEFALVRNAAGLGEREAAEAVEELVRRHLLQALGDRFDFTHDRIRTAAYSQLLEPRRTLYHRQVAEALERLYAGNLEPHAVALATHFREGKVWDKALRYWRQAGIQAVARSANRAAAACFEQALEVLPHLPETRARLEEEADLRLELRTPLHALGQVVQGAECAREAERLAGKLGDPHRLARASDYLCHYSRLYGRLAEAVVLGRRALAIADELDDPHLGVSASFSLGLAHSYLGDYSEAEALFRRTINAVRANRLEEDRCGLDGLPAVMAPAHLARMLAECGRYEEGAILGKKAVAVAEALDHPYSLVMACWGLGWLSNIRGAFDDAIALLERACAISRKWEFAVWLPNGLEQLGLAYACSGRLDEGVRLLEESFKGYVAGGRRPLTTNLGEAYLLADRPDDAMAFAEETLMLSQRGRERRMEAFALALLGGIACRRGPAPFPGAEVRYRDATTLAEALGMRPLVAHCHIGLGELHRRTGKPEQARTHLATGTAMYREMDMRFWLERAEAVSLVLSQEESADVA
jgi:tetratricopeptide (TPR) repeat protein